MTDVTTRSAAHQEPAAQPERSWPPLHRNRDFLILWTSQVASTIGTRVTSVAYPLLVLAVTRSPAAAGLVAFAQTLPYLLLYLPAGALVDRWPRKRVMLACEIARAIALGSVAAAIALNAVTVPQLAVVAFVEGSCFVFFDLCEGAALPQLVSERQLPSAIAQNQARIQGADLVGQPLGGLLFSASSLLPFLFDAVTYLVSFGAVAAIRSPLQATRERTDTRLRDEIAEGVRFVLRQPFLRTSVVLVGAMNFASSAFVLGLIVRAQDLGAGPAVIGGIFAAFGVGALIGSVFAPWFQRRFAARTVMVGIAWLWAVQYSAVAALPNVVLIAAAIAIGSLAGPVFNVTLGSVIYRVTPEHMLARVRSSARLVAWGAIPLGSLTAGWLTSAFSAQVTLATVGVIHIVVAIVATLAGGMRQIPEPRPA